MKASDSKAIDISARLYLKNAMAVQAYIDDYIRIFMRPKRNVRNISQNRCMSHMLPWK
jgi:hypothetical protein